MNAINYIILLLPVLNIAMALMFYAYTKKYFAYIIVSIQAIFTSVVLVDFLQINSFAIKYEWFQLNHKSYFFSIHYGANELLSLILLGIVATCIYLFSIKYMLGKGSYSRYWLLITAFSAAMSFLILANDPFTLFFFWEGVGVLSTLLIGHFYLEQHPIANAQKSFLINRVGDLFFLLGILYYLNTNSVVTFTEISNSNIPSESIYLLIIGCFCKSAQFPFSPWIPAAMSGPTTVSALIHAATMVTAGIIVLVKLSPAFTPNHQLIIQYVGIISFLLGAIFAIQQHQLKSILAYSTISQLGLMTASIGFANPEYTVQQVVAHGFYKANLFLIVAFVIDQQSLFNKITSPQLNVKLFNKNIQLSVISIFLFFAIAGLCGLPGFLGGYTKDLLLISAFEKQPLIFYLLIAGSIGTIIYSVQLVARIEKIEVQPTSIIKCNYKPFYFVFFILTIFSVYGVSNSFFNNTPKELSGIGSIVHTWLPWAFVVLFILVFSIRKKIIISPEGQIKKNYETYPEQLGELVLKVSIPIITFLDSLIHQFILLLANGNILLSKFIGWIDVAIIDSLIMNVSGTFKLAGKNLRELQTGKVQQYFLMSILALITIIFTILYFK